MTVYSILTARKLRGRLHSRDYGNDEAKVSAHLTRLAVRRSARKEVSGTNKAAELNRPLPQLMRSSINLNSMILGAVQ